MLTRLLSIAAIAIIAGLTAFYLRTDPSPGGATISRAPAATGRYVDGQIFKAGTLALGVNEFLQTRNGQYGLHLQDDGRLALDYVGHRLFSIQTKRPDADRVSFQDDGNLVIYAGSNPVWSSETAGHPHSSLHFQDDGNLVIYSPTGGVLWSTQTGWPSAKMAGRDELAINPPSTKVITTLFPTDDVVIADFDVASNYGADASGVNDSTSAIQQALSDCAKAEGGTVWLRAGNYRVTKTVGIPDFCTLRGDWSYASLQGTVISADVQPGLQGASVFTVGGSAGIVGMTIFYPRQNLPNVTPYNYAITVPAVNSAGYMMSTIENITLLNAYRGIAVSPVVTRGHEITTIKNIYGSPLETGLFATNSADVDVYEDIHFSPSYWAGAGAAFHAPSLGALQAYTKNHATAFEFGDLEWSQFINLQADFYGHGIRIVPGSRIQFAGSFYKAEIRNAKVALEVESSDRRFVRGIVFADSVLSAAEASVKNVSRALVTFHHSQLIGARIGAVSILSTEAKLTPLTIATPPKTTARALFNVTQPPYLAARIMPNTAGVIPTVAIDSTNIIQSALDAAGLKGGGIVYLPPGWYSIAGHLSVPENVELRGSSSVPTRDQAGASGGTVLFATEGQNSPTAQTDPALITLNGRRAGVSGLRIFYPYNSPSKSFGLAAFPFAIRAKGAQTYARNIGLSNVAYGLDFSTYKNEGHFIDRIAGNARFIFIKAGNGSGVIHDVIGNVNSPYRNGYGLQRTAKEGSDFFQADIDKLRKTLTFIQIMGGDEGSAEVVANVFAYGARAGLSNAKSGTVVYNIGTDNLGEGYTIEATEPVQVVNLLRYNGKGSVLRAQAGTNVQIFNDDVMK